MEIWKQNKGIDPWEDLKLIGFNSKTVMNIITNSKNNILINFVLPLQL